MGLLNFLRERLGTDTDSAEENDPQEETDDIQSFSSLREEIYLELLSRGPMTDSEINVAFDNYDYSVLQTSLEDLSDDGKIRSVSVGSDNAYKARGRGRGK